MISYTAEWVLPMTGPPMHRASISTDNGRIVAIDEHGRARAVPPLAPVSPDELRRLREAEIRRAHRLAKRDEIDQGRLVD